VTEPYTDTNYKVVKRLLLDRLVAICPTEGLKMPVEWAAEETLENARKFRHDSCADIPVVIAWDLRGDLPHFVVSNKCSPLFDPSRYLDRDISEIEFGVLDSDGKINAHLGTQALAGLAKHISYLWRAEDGREVTAVLRQVEEEKKPTRYIMKSVLKLPCGAEVDDFNLVRFLADSPELETMPWESFTIGVLFADR
jgi:hypothetical protein